MAIETGIESYRLIFAEKILKHKHLSRLALADLVLDTHRVDGAASTSDALWAGVPVLTVQGKHFASRMASSILKAGDLNELVTNSLSEYENKAVILAKKNKIMENIKSKLIANCRKSNLFNTKEFVNQLEKAYKIIYKRYLHGKKPCITYLNKP